MLKLLLTVKLWETIILRIYYQTFDILKLLPIVKLWETIILRKDYQEFYRAQIFLLMSTLAFNVFNDFIITGTFQHIHSKILLCTLSLIPVSYSYFRVFRRKKSLLHNIVSIVHDLKKKEDFSLVYFKRKLKSGVDMKLHRPESKEETLLKACIYRIYFQRCQRFSPMKTVGKSNNF